MKQKIFLTSVIAISIAVPAMATPTNTSSTFPASGFMAADTTYTGQATSTNLAGVYQNNATVNALAGYNLCPAGSYCDGSSNTPTACSTVGNGSYTSSAEGSDASTDCYKTCSTIDVSHATAVTGRMYSNGTNQCSATACSNGYHLGDPTFTLYPGNPNLTTAIGVTQAGTAYAAIDNNGNDENDNASTYGLSSVDTNAFVVDYGNGKKVTGHGRCSRSSTENDPWWVGDNGDYVLQSDGMVDSLTDETGQSGANYCYCHLDSYTASANGTATPLSGPWLFSGDDDYDSSACAGGCANRCAVFLQSGSSNDLSFRSAMFGSLGASITQCVANTINISWSDASAADIAANEAGSCTYDGDIRTPSAATAKPGKTFKGWKFFNLGE